MVRVKIRDQVKVSIFQRCMSQ